MVPSYCVVCSPCLTSIVKIPSRERQRRAKRREEYIQNRDGELETSRVRYDANRAFIFKKRGRVCCDEQNSDELRFGSTSFATIILYLATYNADPEQK